MGRALFSTATCASAQVEREVKARHGENNLTSQIVGRMTAKIMPRYIKICSVGQFELR